MRRGFSKRGRWDGSRLWTVVLVCWFSGLLSACKPSCRSPTEPALLRNANQDKVGSAPVTLFSIGKSAYHVKLAFDGDTLYLLTPDSVFRLAPGQPPQGSRLDLGAGAVVTSSGFVFWSKSKVWIAPKSGGAPVARGEVVHAPQFFVAWGERFAWIDRSDDGRFSIRTLRGSNPIILHAPAGSVDSATMLSDRVVFVERTGPATWRLGSVRLDGGAPTFSPERTGRSPSMLVAGADVYYYDGNAFEVRAIASDLRQERVLASDIICSPLAASDRLYCGQVEGLFELALDGRARRLFPNLRYLITAIAADRNRVAWVSEAGSDQLEVKMLVRDTTP